MADELVAIRRYPVKSMGGESLDRVELDARGLAWDRWYAVVDGDGRLSSAKSSRRFRRRDEVLGYAAHAAGEQVTVSGPEGRWVVGDPELDAVLSRRTGTPVRVLAEQGTPHQDGGAVSLVGTATLRWCEERWGVAADPRRLRVNLVLGTTEPFVEESWVGSTVGVGESRLRVVERIPRCRTVDVAQDGIDPQGRLLRPLTEEREMCLAVYADVVSGATLRLGDPVEA